MLWGKVASGSTERRRTATGVWIMNICIWRGARQIGGTCIEIESQGKRLVLDIGQPLDSPDAESVEMPRVEGLKTPDNSLLGVVLSHPHLDHYGLAFRVPPSGLVLQHHVAVALSP